MPNANTNHRAKQTAAECYAERQDVCQGLLERVVSRLEQHKKDHAQEPANGRYPGDLGRVTEEHAYVLVFLGDRSAVNQLALGRILRRHLPD